MRFPGRLASGRGRHRFPPLNRRALGSAGSCFLGLFRAADPAYTARDDRPEPRIGVVGATGAVGAITLELPRRARLHEHPRVRSARSAGRDLGGFEVEEATPEALGGGRPRPLPLLRRHAGEPRARPACACAAARSASTSPPLSGCSDGVPLVVPEVNGGRALEHEGIIANPNCCAIPLTMVLSPLHDAAGLARVRVATYQSVSGAGAQAMRATPRRGAGGPPPAHGLGLRRCRVRRGGEAAGRGAQDPRAPRPTDQRDVCPRAGLVGHAESVWIETADAVVASDAESPRGGAGSPAREDPQSRSCDRRRRSARRARQVATRPPRTAWCSSSSATTSARAPR